MKWLLTKTYEANILKRSTDLVGRFLNSAPLFNNVNVFVKKFSILPWKNILIFLFTLSLVLLPGYDQSTSGALLKSSLSETIQNKQASTVGVVIFLMLLVPLIVMLIRQYGTRRIYLKFYTFELLFLVLFVLGELSAIISYDPQISFLWLLKLARGILVYFVFSRLFLDRKQIHLIIYTLFISVFLEGLLSTGQFFHQNLLGLPIESSSEIRYAGSLFLNLNNNLNFRPPGTFSHPNALSFYLAFLLPLGLAFTFSKNASVKITAYLISFIILLSFVLTLSRWGVLTTVFAFLTTLILLIKYLGKNFMEIFVKMRIFLAIFLLVFIVIFYDASLVRRFLQFSTDEVSFGSRISLIQQAMSVIQRYPLLGIGGGTFPGYLINYDETTASVSSNFPAPVHSLYLLLASETGIVSLAVFLLAVVMIFRLIFTKLSSLTAEDRLMAIGLISSCFVFLFNGLWERSIQEHLAILFWMNTGLLVNILLINKKRFT